MRRIEMRRNESVDVWKVRAAAYKRLRADYNKLREALAAEEQRRQAGDYSRPMVDGRAIFALRDKKEGAWEALRAAARAAGMDEDDEGFPWPVA